MVYDHRNICCSTPAFAGLWFSIEILFICHKTTQLKCTIHFWRVCNLPYMHVILWHTKYMWPSHAKHHVCNPGMGSQNGWDAHHHQEERNDFGPSCSRAKLLHNQLYKAYPAISHQWLPFFVLAVSSFHTITFSSSSWFSIINDSSAIAQSFFESCQISESFTQSSLQVAAPTLTAVAVRFVTHPICLHFYCIIHGSLLLPNAHWENLHLIHV